MLRQLPLPPTARFPVSPVFHRGTAPGADAPPPAAPPPDAATAMAAVPARNLRPGAPTAAETTRAAAPDRAPARLTERNA